MVQPNTTQFEATYLGGGQFTTLPPVFKDDATTLYIAWKNQISGYNCKSGRKVQEFTSLNDEIVGFGSTFKNGEECLVACTSAGNVCTWRVRDAMKINESCLSITNIRCFKVIMDRTTNESKAIVVFEDSDESIIRKEDSKASKPPLIIALADYKERSIQFLPISIDKKTKELKYSLDIGEIEGGSKYLVFVQSNYLYYVDLKSNENGKFFVKRHKIASPKYYTTVIAPPAGSPTPNCLVGDSLGRITLYTDLAATRPIHSTMHWHTLPVRALAMSASGTRLFSGGGEGVMVRWGLDGGQGDGAASKLGFVPRLGGAVTWIGVMGDGGVAVQVEGMGVCVLEGGGRGEEGVWIRTMMSMGSNLNVGMVYDNRSKCMILNGVSGNIQFYSPTNGTSLYYVDVVSRNRLTHERNKTMANIQVKHVAVNEIGSWYATVEERLEKDAIYELRLKFWNFDAETQKFHLNTSIEYPHEKEIYGLEFRPNRKKDKFDQCVTISRDGLFKIWHLVEILGVDGALSLSWRCATTAYYKPPFCAACLSFSKDGSVLALGYGPAITIWLPDTCQLKRSLTYDSGVIASPKSVDFIKSLAFGKGRCNYLIVGVTKKHIMVWNLLTYALTLRIKMDIATLIPDPSSCVMAVLKKDNTIYFFEPDQEQPITEFKIPEENLITHCSFVPQQATIANFENKNSKLKSQFFYLNTKQELYCLGAKIKTAEGTIEPLQITSSNYSKLLAAKISSTVKNQENRKIMHENPNIKNQLKKLLDTPNHTQIPLSLVACSFLHSLVLNKQASLEQSTETPAEISSSSTFEHRINGRSNTNTGPKPGTLLYLNKIKIKDTEWVKIL